MDRKKAKKKSSDSFLFADEEEDKKKNINEEDWDDHYEDFESVSDEDDDNNANQKKANQGQNNDDLELANTKKTAPYIQEPKKKPAPDTVKRERPDKRPDPPKKKKGDQNDASKATDGNQDQSKSKKPMKMSQLKTKLQNRIRGDKELSKTQLKDGEIIDLEESFEALKKLVRTKRMRLYTFIKNEQETELEDIKELIDNNEYYVEIEEQFTGEGNKKEETAVVKRLGSLNPKNWLSFDALSRALRSFEFTAPIRTLKLICYKLFVYNFQLGLINYPRFLRQTYRYRAKYNKPVGLFYRARVKKLNKKATSDSKYEDEEDLALDAKSVKLRSIQLIQKQFRGYLKVIRDRKLTEQQKKIAKLREEVDTHEYTPKEMVEILRDKAAKSDCQPLELIQKYRLEDNDMISRELFQKIVLEDLKFRNLSSEFLDQVFYPLDLIKRHKISFNAFVATFYEAEGIERLTYPDEPAEILQVARKAARHHYDSATKFLTFAKRLSGDKVSIDEFLVIIKDITRFKQHRIKKLFNFLDIENEGFLYDSSLLKIYEGSKRSSKVISMKKSFDNEHFKSLMDMNMSGIGLGSGGGFGGFGEIGGHGSFDDKPEMGGIVDEAGYGMQNDPSEFSMDVDRGQIRQRKDQIEELIMHLSLDTYERIKYHGKNVKDLFQMFADKLTRMMNFDEFCEMSKFILQGRGYLDEGNKEKKKEDEEILQGCYYLFAWPSCKKITYTKFMEIIEMGKAMNPLYIKVKNRYQDLIYKYKELYKEELMKMDSKEGEGYVTLLDVTKLFNINKIHLSEVDCEFLKDDGIIVLRDKINYVDVNLFMKKVFPNVSVFDKFVQKKSVSKIENAYLKYKVKKVERNRQDQFLELLAVGDSYMSESMDKQRGKKRRKGRKGKGKKGKILEKDDGIKKPAEVFEIAGGDKTPSRDSPNLKDRKSFSSNQKLAQRMSNLLIPKKTSLLSAAMKAKIQQAVRSILHDVINQAVTYGESLCLSKAVQRRYAMRPVTKDVFILINEAYIDVINVVPNSLSMYQDIGRIMYLNNDGVLKQYDVVNNDRLTGINLITRIPSKKTLIIDYLLDSETGNLYILKENWDLELWDIFQEKKSPKSNIRLVQNYVKGTPADVVFKNRHLGIFPRYMNLSENREFLIINTTLKNSTILFIDPVSLSILNQVIFRPSDYSIPENLDRYLFEMKPLFEKFSKKQLNFSKLFSNDLVTTNNTKHITLDTLKSFLNGTLRSTQKSKSNSIFSDLKSIDLKDSEIEEVVRFIDQDGDGLVSEEEFLFLIEIVRYTETSSKVYVSCEIPEELAAISKGAVNILLEMYDFVKSKNYSVKEALSIFDANHSGVISVEEFYNLVNEICQEATMEDKKAFFSFVDKNQNGFIELDEFNQLFKLFGNYSVQELIPSENPRFDIFSMIERAYENDINIEQKFQKFDRFNQGFIDSKSFGFLMKSLPFGIGDNEVNHFLNNYLDFTNNGDINYMNLINTERFKRIKFVYMMKNRAATAGGGFAADLEKSMMTSQDKENYEGVQKLVIENVVYIDSIDVIAYTTVCPKTSMIFVAKLSDQKQKMSKKARNRAKNAKTAKNARNQAASLLEEYECSLLARLVGHHSGEPPTFIYVPESGCIVSGEKFPIRKASLESMQNTGSYGLDIQEPASKYYNNIIADNLRVARISIYNLDKELYKKAKINPPWIIKPTRVIDPAHNDSIVSLAYMKINQLIVSSSIDGCIKFWDPVARSHQLTHKDSLQQLKPGYYTYLKQEDTRTNTSFAEVRRIYTGELTCYNLCPIYAKVKTTQIDEGIPEYYYIEFLSTLELGESQRISGKLTSKGVIKVYGMERMGLEIPVCRFLEPIPKQLTLELEELAINNRQLAKMKMKRRLPQKLEKLNSKLVIQTNDIKKIGRLLKIISMKRYNRKMIDLDVKALFEFLVHLPVRGKISSKQHLTISEIHMHLKKNSALFPRNIGKEAFLTVVKKLVSLGAKYLVDQRTKRSNKLFNLLSDLIMSRNGEIEQIFDKSDYSWMEMKRKLKDLDADDKDFEEFFSILDPFYSNKILTQDLRDLFTSEIIEAKMKVFARPNFIISQLNAVMSKTNKVALLRNLFEADTHGIGRITQKDFILSFSSLSRKVDQILVRELFELLSENYNGEVLLNLSLFCKKLLTHSEQFELARVYSILAKLKNALRFRMLSLEHVFMEHEQEFRGKSIKSLNITIPVFQRKVKELKVQGMKPRDIDVMSHFLSTVDKHGSKCISYITVQSYFRKIDLKYQYLHLVDYKTMQREAQKILDKKAEFARKWQKICKKELIGFSEMRLLLNYFQVDEHVVDLILLKFVDNETSSVLFLNKLQSFCEMNSFLENPRKLDVSYLRKIGSALADGFLKPKQADPGANESNFEDATGRQDTSNPFSHASDDTGAIDILLELVIYIEEYESEKTVLAALEICKKFDVDNTGRIALADFINILTFNLKTGKSDRLESLFLKLENDFVVERNIHTIEYTELFQKLDMKNKTRQNMTDEISVLSKDMIKERSLTEIIDALDLCISKSNLDMNAAYKFFDNVGFIMKNEFLKILGWIKFDISDAELDVLYAEIEEGDAVNYEKLNNLIKIHKQHINVRFDFEIWMLASRHLALNLMAEINRNLDYIKEPLLKEVKEDNPLISAAYLDEILHQFKEEFSEQDVEKLLRYAVVGSCNNLNTAYKKMREPTLNWRFENLHAFHFLKSVPLVYQRNKDLPENKESARNINENSKKNIEIEKSHIINKVKVVLRERGVTMWESLLSCSVSVVEKSKLMKNDFLRMLRIMNLDLTVKEKALLLKVLIGEQLNKDRIDLNVLLRTFESEPVTSKKSVGQTLLLEKMIYGLYYAGFSPGRAFDKMDVKGKGVITKKELFYGLSEFDLGLSVFEINQILEVLGVTDNFTRLPRNVFKSKIKSLMRANKINLLQNFSISLLARIQHLVDVKQRNLLECFREEDQYKNHTADLKMLKNALERFGLVNIKKHEIKTLVKVFKSDVNFMQPDEDEQEPSEQQKEKSNTLSLDFMMDIPNPKKEKKKKKFDIEDENFKIDYKEFVDKIYAEIEHNKRLFKGSYQVLRKVYNMTKVKGLTVFESYVYFDVNNINQISNMELRLGLQNLEIMLEKYEMDNLWNVFEKNYNNKVTFSSFLNAFINANCFDIIKFDDKVKKLLKKFTFLITKHGNCEELFRKFDSKNDGFVTLDLFKSICEKFRLGLNEEEINLIFKSICSPENFGAKPTRLATEVDEDDDESQQNEAKPYRYFNFKKFVTMVSYFRKKDHFNKILYKFDSLLKEKDLSYKQIIRDFKAGLRKKRKRGKNKSFNFDNRDKKKGLGIEIRQMKDMILGLDLGINNEEVNAIVDSFEDDYITVNMFERTVRNAIKVFERENNKKSTIFSKVVTDLQEVLIKEHVSLQRIFVDFDSSSTGSLTLAEFSKMLNFFHITLNKKEIKIIFDEIDFEHKGAITFKEFQTFFDQNLFRKAKRDRKKKKGASGATDSAAIELIVKTMQKAVFDSQTSLERVISSANVNVNHVASQKVIEQLLMKMNCVLKRDQIKAIFEVAGKDGVCSYADLIDWGIKNKIDCRTQGDLFPQFPPAVQVILSKMFQIFKKLDMQRQTAFKYFTTENENLSMRNDFLILVQGLQIQTSEDELVALYNFFDERNYGEISKNAFLEKCELATNFYKWSQQENLKQNRGLMTLTLRQHVMSALEKIHTHFMEKKFNKNQIFAVFDTNGTGKISRAEFIRMIENLKIQIPLDHVKSSLNYLDTEETGVIDINTFLKKMVKAVPEHAKNTYRNTQALNIMGKFVSKLKVHLEKFLNDILELEKKLQISDILSRDRTGVPIYEFYRLLGTYGIRLKENDKLLINSSFKHKKKPDYFNTELLYMSLERLAKEVGSSFSNIEGENIEYWEVGVLRKVADQLRKLNMTLEQAFKKFSSSDFGYVKKVEFKQLILSLQIDLSQKDIDLLIKRLVTKQNPNVISFNEFRERFWNCFFESRAQIHPVNIENRTRQIASIFLHKIKFDLQLPLSEAWNKMDGRDVGSVSLNDLKEFLIMIEMPITKQDLGFLFTLLDKNHDGIMDQYEFAEFWNLNLPADFEVKKHKMKKLENDVLGKISRFINRKNINLDALMKRYDNESQGYLSQDNMMMLLSEIGLDINESTTCEIMKLITSGNNPQRIYYSEFETALLRNGLNYVNKKGLNMIEFHNKLVERFFNGLNLEANKQKIDVGQLLTQFDENYDGFLTRNEFYNLIRTFTVNFKFEEFQRISHIFSSNEHDNEIDIKSILRVHKSFTKTESKLQDGLCDYDVFSKTIQHFDPTVQLFKRWSILKQTEIKFRKFLQNNREKIRGFKLVAYQVKINQIERKLRRIEKNLDLGTNFLKNKSLDLVTKNAKIKFIDKAYNDMLVQELQSTENSQIAGLIENTITTSQQFNIDYSTMSIYNRYVKTYLGDLLIDNQTEKVFISNYPAPTLRKTMKSGKFFEEHLKFEITAHTNLHKYHPDIFSKIYGVYEKNVGIEKDDKELLVFHEVLSEDWVSFENFINSTGGMIRIPYLMTSNAVSKVAKFWFKKILQIVDIVHQNNVCLYYLKPENFFINVKSLEVKLCSLRGAAKVNEDGKLDYVTDLTVLRRAKQEASGEPHQQMGSTMKSGGLGSSGLLKDEVNDAFKDPFIAPEFFYQNALEYTQKIDSWALGAFFYFIIFGEYPKKMTDSVPIESLKSTQEPSNFTYFDFISEESLRTIITHDYDIELDDEFDLIITALRSNSFQSIFDFVRESRKNQKIFAGDNQSGLDSANDQNSSDYQSTQASTLKSRRTFRTTKKDEEAEQQLKKIQEHQIGDYIDLIMIMLNWKEFERPSPRTMLNSELFASDAYQIMQMRQFSSIAFFYRSPSKCVRENILLPLRKMAAFVIESPIKIINLTDDLIRMVDNIIECLVETQQFSSNEIKSELAKENLQLSAIGSGVGFSSLQQSRLVMDSITYKMNEGSTKREKSPNYALVKYMFNFHVFDILLFLILRHHKEINKQIADSADKIIDFDKLENNYYSPIKGFKVIMQKLVYDLKSYEGASAPYVGQILDILVKFCVGEEFHLASEIQEELEMHSNMIVKRNDLEEYKLIQEKFKKTRLGYFFNPLKKKDFADLAWEKSLTSEPYCFKSQNWSLYLNSIATSLLREVLGDAGLGSPNHQVIMDYVRFVTSKKKAPGFEGDATIRYFNSLLKRDIKSVDYFNEIFVLTKNIVILNDPNSGSTSIKVVINYVKTVMNARNVDKVKAILDSRILIKCLNYLQSPDVNLRTSLLELIKVATSSFSRDHLYLYEQYDINSKFDDIKDVKLRSIDEIQKHFGLIAHLVVTNEDNMNNSHYTDCVRNYFMVNSKVCEKYLHELSMCTVTPSFTLALLSTLKRKTEIMSNKVNALDIIYNMTNAPEAVIRNLSHATLDTWTTCAKILAVTRTSKSNKHNEYLLPYGVKIFRNIMTDSRTDTKKYYDKLIGLGTLLKEQKLTLPRKMSLKYLADLVEEVDFQFKKHYKAMVKEVNATLVSNYSRHRSSRTPRLKSFSAVLKEACIKIICFLHFESRKVDDYSPTILQDLVYFFISNIQTYYDLLSSHSHISDVVTDILILISNFMETLVNLEFEYFIFDAVNLNRGQENLQWLLIQLYSIYNYFSVLEFNQDPEEDEKLEELRINKIDDIEKRGKELVKMIKNSGCLRKYARNRQTQCGHSFLRILLNVLCKDDPEYNRLFEAVKFGFFFSSLIQKQYSILQLFITTKTENIHVISRYVEESNLRLRIFEAILKSSSQAIQSELLESQCIQRIASSMMMSHSEFDVSYYRSNYKFLPFRNFQPFRGEAICMVSVIFWNKGRLLKIYNELINEFVKCNTFSIEVENLRQSRKKLRKLSALNFFSRLIRAGDKNLLFLMRKQYVLLAIEKVFEEDKDLTILYKDTAQMIENMTYKL